jgi:hypothetical protein
MPSRKTFSEALLSEAILIFLLGCGLLLLLLLAGLDERSL